MIVDVVMPKMGESINEGTILEWRKEVGEKDFLTINDRLSSAKGSWYSNTYDQLLFI